jgi:hypothetical protein
MGITFLSPLLPICVSFSHRHPRARRRDLPQPGERETNSGWVRSDQPHVKKLPHGNSSALYLYAQLHINRHSSVPVSLLFPPFLVFGIAFTMDVS